MTEPQPPAREITLIAIPQKNVDVAELRRSANEGKGTEFFRDFHFGTLVQYGQPLAAYGEVLRVLTECRALDETAFETIHKGGPYYWLGMAAFLARDFETAVYFMDAAVSEDLKNYPSRAELPALLFIQLRGEHPAQAAKELASQAQASVQLLIDTYNSTVGSAGAQPPISLQDIRDWFLSKALLPANLAWRSLATALISYALEADLRDVQRALVITPSSNEAFILHLFKGAVLLESLLKLNPRNAPPGKTLNPVLTHLAGDLGLQPPISTSADQLQDVVDEARTLPHSIQSAFQIAAKVRNTTGHSLGWSVSISQADYRDLYQRIGVACVHAMRTLYS